MPEDSQIRIENPARGRYGRRMLALGVLAWVFVGVGMVFEGMLIIAGWGIGITLVVLGVVAVKRKERNGVAMLGYVLGLLVLVVPLALVWMSDRGNVETLRRQSTLMRIREITHELEAFKGDMGRYPTMKEGLEALVHVPPELVEKRKGPYRVELPYDTWGRAFIYRMPGKADPEEFDLISAGSDGEAGTADDIDRMTRK